MKHCAVFLLAITCVGADWMRFRGPSGSGIDDDSSLPIKWAQQSDENIVWRSELPGRGLSGPIVVGERIFLTCCSGYRQDRLHVLCLDTAAGEVLWERQLWATGRTMTHPSISTAAPTPVSDGERVFVYFSTNDVACFDLDGNLLWLRALMLEFPNASNSLGLASSPVVLGETLVLPIEGESESVAVGLNAATGATRWQLDRPKSGNWTTPVALRSNSEQPAVGLQSGSMLTVHDPLTGQELWRHEQACSTIPSCVVAGQVLFVPSDGITAMQFTRTAASVLWQSNRLGPSTATPLVYRGKLFTVSGSILKCADPATGRLLTQLRLKGNFSSSPVAANGRIYLFNEDGLGQVIEIDGDKLQLLEGGDLQERILCTPAIADGALYVRSDEHLWKIGAGS